MNVNYVNPFIDAFRTVMTQLGFGQIRKGELSVISRDLVSSGAIIIVGVVGAIKGNVVYTLDIDSAKRIASTMMTGMPVDNFDEMAQSAISELTNMLTANAATSLYNMKLQIDISTPALLYGDNISIKMSAAQVLRVQLLADEIPIYINIAFED
jgi:chemotaxis protein CheX